MTFGGGRPPQLVVGNSGSELDPAVTTPLPGQVIADLPVAVGLNLDRFGFVTLEVSEGGWHAVLRTSPVSRCSDARSAAGTWTVVLVADHS